MGELEAVGVVVFVICSGSVALLAQASRADSSPSPAPTNFPQPDPSKAAPYIEACKRSGTFALTFDDGPSSYVPRLLDILKANGVKATFFINGRNFAGLTQADSQDRLRRAFNEGHQIASHTLTHADLATLSNAAMWQEMADNDALIKAVIGKRPVYMRPPYGSYNDNVLAAMGNPKHRRATRSRAAAEVDEAPSAPTPKAPARTSSRTNNRAAAADKRAAAAAAASEAFSDSSVDSRDDEGDSNAEETPVRGKRTPQAAPKTSVAAVAATRGVKRTAAAPDSGSDAGEQLDDDDDDDDELASPTSSGRRSSVRRAGSAPQTPMAVRKQAPAAQRAKQAKPKAPAKNKPKKAAAASNNGGNDDGDNNENDENNSEINDAPLYETVIEHGAAIETVMSDWLRAFKSDKMGSMHQVVNFLIRASGCDAQVDREAVEDSDEIAAALEAIQEQCNTDAQQDYPLAPKGKGRSAAKFRCAFVAFWTRWTNTVSSQLLSIGDSSPIELLARWLATMSSASFRPFRHTATIAALATMTGLCTAAQFVLTALVTAQRQVAAEEGKGASRRLEQMRSRVSDLQARKDRLEQHMLDIYDGIFVHRYRDTDPVIRAECIRELGVWIATYPEFYLETAHLRYLGWMLSDKAAHVRMEALKSLCRLYKTDALVSGLREFTNRFMARMMEMGASEKDSAVRHEAAQAICLLANAGMLEDTDYEAVVPLIFDADPKIRTIVAPLVAGWYKDTFQQPVLDEYLAVGTLRDSQRSLIELKTLAQALCRISELVAERLRPAAPKQPSAGQASSQMQSQLAASQSQSQLAGEDMDMDDAQEFANATDDFRFDTHGMSAHHEDDVAQLKKDLEHVVDYAKAQAGSGSSADAADSQLGFNSVCAAVSALWKHIGCLSDYKRMGEYLLLDDADAEAGKPRAQRGAARGRASSAADVDDEGTPSLQLSEIEETCLVFMMAASVACVLADADQDASAPAKPAKTAAGDTAETAEAARQGVSEALIRFVPLLLQKYGTEVSGTVHERLVEVVALVRSIQLGMYLHTRQSKQFEALFDDLAKLFLAQYEPAFLREACETFKFLLGRDAVDASSAALLAKPKSRVDAMQPSGASASASVLHSIADAKLHDLVDALFARQLANATSQLALDATPESLTALTRSVVRARELMFHIDLSGTDVFVASRTQVDASQGENLGVVDATLNAVLESLKHLSDGVSPDQERELLALASVAMQGAIEIATFDLAFQVKQAYEAHQRSNRSAESNGGARADADGDADMDQDGQASPVDPAVQRRLRGRCDSIVTLCEAIATNTSHIADITFTLPMRWACVRTLMSIYPLINGEAGEAFPDLVHRPSPDVMAESAFLVDRLVHLSTFIETPVPEGVIAAGLTGAAAREAARRALLGVGGAAYLRHAIFKTADGLRRMASFGMFARRHGNVLLKYYGIDAPQLETWLRKLSFLDAQRDGHEVSGVRPIAGVLGAVWGGLSSALIEDVVGAGIKRAVSDYTSRLAQGVSERHALSLAKDAIQDLCDLILDSIAASIDLHLTTRSPSLDHTHALAKALVAQLKTWPSVLTPGGIEAVTPALKQLHSVTVRALLVMLCDAGTWMARRTSAWRSLSQSMTKRRQSGFTEMTSFLSDTTRMGANVSLDEDASAWTCASFGIVADAARVNSAWQVWGVIGGVVAHVVQGLFVLVPRGAETDAPQRDTVTSTEGVLHVVSDSLARMDVKPIEGEPVWAAYWQFVEALQKADASVAKRKGGRKAAGGAAGGAAAAAGASKRRASGRAPSALGRRKSGGGRRVSKAATEGLDSDEGSDDADDLDRSGLFRAPKRSLGNASVASDEEAASARTPRRSSRSAPSRSSRRSSYKDISDSEVEEVPDEPAEDEDEAEAVEPPAKRGARARRPPSKITTNLGDDDDEVGLAARSDSDQETALPDARKVRRGAATAPTAQRGKTQRGAAKRRGGASDAGGAGDRDDDGFASSPDLNLGRKRMRRV